MPEKLDLDTALVRKLAKLLEETGLSEIEYAEGDKKIRCAVTRETVAQTPPAVVCATPVAVVAEGRAIAKGTPVPSPMVGTVYLSPAPNAPTFVKVGDTVKQGDTLLVIEAMKVMNPIKAPVGGKISEIFVANANPVEFGETLMLIA